MESIFRPFKKVLIYAAFTLMILFIVFAVNQAAQIYTLAGGVHPYLGYAALVLVGFAFALILVVPLYGLLTLRKRPEMPKSVDDPKFDAYVQTLKSRLKTNPYLLGQGFVFDEHGEPKIEVMRALALLDAEATKLVKKGASSVFLTTAISQNGALDSIFVISSLMRMIWDVSHIYNQRPGFREIAYLYGNISATVLMARSVEDLDLMDDQLEPVIASILGGSLGSLIPGTVYVTNLLINSITEGSVNALLCLRVGAMAKRYSGSLVDIDKAVMRRSASMEAIGLLGGIVRDNTTYVIHAFGNAAKGATRKIFRRKNDAPEN
ncbi:DUF697 domain-containing protein [Proteiniclasticum sp.]|uniref:DUF697 domain-containing protein n=1 Tax=Proteiniclasticum sp. TaxID=2053595 RepID=UPI00289E4C29|nr:DUF697 domain-containing protein [Proteiniclasticum sp.]